MDNKKESPYKLNNINIDENSIRIKNIIMLFTIYLGTSVVVGLILPLLNLTITEDTVYNLLGTLNVIVTLIALILILFYSKKNNLKLFNRESKGTKNPVRYILLVLYTMCAMTLPSVILNYANNVNANGNATSANQEPVSYTHLTLPTILRV